MMNQPTEETPTQVTTEGDGTLELRLTTPSTVDSHTQRWGQREPVKDTKAGGIIASSGAVVKWNVIWIPNPNRIGLTHSSSKGVCDPRLAARNGILRPTTPVADLMSLTLALAGAQTLPLAGHTAVADRLQTKS